MSVQELWWCVSSQGSLTDSLCVSQSPSSSQGLLRNLFAILDAEGINVFVSGLTFTRDQSFGALGLWFPLQCILTTAYSMCIFRANEKGRIRRVSWNIFCSATNQAFCVLCNASGNLFETLIFVLCFAFLVNLCTLVLLFSHVFIAVLFLLYVLDTANEEADFKESLCFSWILKPHQCGLTL